MRDWNPFSHDGHPSDRGLDRQLADKRQQRERQQREAHEKRVLSDAYKRAMGFFEGEEAIDPETFTLYDQEMIRKDGEYVADMERRFAAEEQESDREKKRLAIILEAIIHEQIELSNWLGPDAQTKKASRFDDIKNGVDSIAEFITEASAHYLALAMDVTYATDPMRKLERIKHEIKDGTLTTVKYFQSSDGTYQGMLSKIPRVVIAIDPARIIELADLWVKGDKKALAKHPVQIQILEEISFQLEAFMRYARRQQRFDIASIMERTLGLIGDIAADSDKQVLARLPSTKHALEQDRAYTRLRAGMNIFNG